MGLRSNRMIRVLFVLLLQCGWAYHSIAAGDPAITKPLLGSINEVQVDAVSDADYTLYNPLPGATQIEQNFVIRNMVSVGMEEESKYYIQTDFTATVVLHITKYGQNGAIMEELDRSFFVEYKKADGAKNKSIQYFPFENAYRVVVKVVSVTPNSGVTWDISRVLRVDNTITAERDYVFNCSKIIENLTATLDAANEELQASWTNPLSGQTEYDLEWAWVDAAAIDEYKDENGNVLPDRVFVNNATRVTITSSMTTYNIPLLYDGAGRVYVRVRPGQLKHSGQRIEGEWSWQNAGSPVYFVYQGHENALNWQASTSFAEEGKRKSVLQYFDGTLRNRQTVTKENTSNTTVVAETFYDYQGRPVIQVLPSPTLGNIIQYTRYFNKSITYATNDGYPKWAYDKLAENSGTCATPASALSTVSGTAKYYSPANEKVNDPATGYNIDKYIPNSEGLVTGQAYPFTETRFGPDGRVAAQGGVGPTHQLGSTHETKYLYEPPAQEELDALFGTDAGVASHYFKNMVKDANGQYSVSYTDMRGRTVATALAGKSPTQLDSLQSSNTKNFTRQLMDDETNRVQGKSIISIKALVVPVEGLYKFKYTLNPEQLSLLNCTTPASPICYDCLYNLKITITSDCNGIGSGGFSYTVVDSNFTIGQSLTSPICNENGKTTGIFNKSFETTLPEGSYTITKSLSLSDSAQNIYRDVFIKNDTCKTFQDFYNKEYQVLLSKSNCAIDCDTCKASIGIDFNAFRLKFLAESGMIEPLEPGLVTQLQGAYQDALVNCTRLCNNEDNIDDGMDPIKAIRSTMLADVTPPYGQYAKLANPSSLFNILNNGKYKQAAGTFKDQFGVPESIEPSLPGYEEFSNTFQSSWAEALLPYHPEYSKLRTTLDKLPGTYQFEADLNSKKTWAAAGSAGFINNIMALDAFFNGTVPGNSAYNVSMSAKMAAYDPVTSSIVGCANSTISPSMWQLAQSAVFCRNVVSTAPCHPEMNTCRLSYAANPTVTPASGCSGDWDMVWQNFRALYLTERKKYISQYVTANSSPNNDAAITTAIYPADTDAAAKLKLRFINFNSIDYTNLDVSGDVQSFFSQLSSGNNAAKATADGLATAQYESACRGYTDMWLAQLSLCPAVATRWATAATKSTDSTWLTDRLVRICKFGADQFHYLGSSSIDPARLSAFTSAGGSGSVQEFPAVIQEFLSTFISGYAASEICHPYLITSPAPFDKQAPVTDQLVITKPADCECRGLSKIKTEYQYYGKDYSNFSTYLKKRYGTDITQGALDTLTKLCNGTYTCIFLPNPIILPPLFQCKDTAASLVKPCIDCKDFQAIRSGFKTVFNKVAPIKVPQNQNDINVNKAFQDYANYKTGYSKGISEYISFIDSCGTFTPGTCDSLQNILDSFSLNLKRGKIIHTFNPRGSNSVITDLQVLADTGTLHLPAYLLDTVYDYNSYAFKLAYGDNFCTSNGYSVEYRFKFLSLDKQGDVFYSSLGGIDFTVQRNYTYINDVQTFINGLFTRIRDTTYVFNPSTNRSVLENWMTFKVKVLPNSFSLYYNGAFVHTFYGTYPLTNRDGFSMSFFRRQGSIDRVKVWDSQDNLKYFEDFNDPSNPAFVDPSFICPAPPNCQTAFTNYFNTKKGTSYTFSQIEGLYLTHCGKVLNVCSIDTSIAAPLSGPVLCGLNKARFEPVPYDDNPCKDLPQIAYSAATEKWQLYVDSLRNVFDTAYYNKCMRAKDMESFTVNYDVKEYHYTLYYYDQSGNLVKTIPPAGVDDKHGDAVFLSQVKAARLSVRNGGAEDAVENQKVPTHTLVTHYRYNTLNQVVAQKTPDGGISKFWYDRLGRLAASQNAKQANAGQLGGKRYSYTIYDNLGRITEVGQKPQSTDPNSRIQSELDTWLTAGGYNKEQITRTRYDLTYDEGSNILADPPSILVQRNLRNRVSYSMVFDTEPDPGAGQITHTAATFYSYDIHGNVDTLLQDLRKPMLAVSPNHNRYKKLVYNYDLISGKVNRVSYQAGLQDEFYHRYLYDAENRLIEVYTSHDNLIWEKDARYSYYRHGPLARTIVGQQQVQGVDYAYTLQGWLKGVNSTAVQQGDAITGNGEDCGGNSAVENLLVNDRMPPYQTKYIAHEGILFTAGFESIAGDNFTAYIDNTLASCGTDGTAGTAYTAPTGNLYDIGRDGVPAGDGTASQVSNDVYGFNLNYFTGDYHPINSAVTPFATVTSPLPGSATGDSLFNGNISSMAVNIPKLGQAHLYGYRYDQLNRIVAMDAFTGLSTSNQWTPLVVDQYKERISYDANGNILTYKRNGNASRPLMDDLGYNYVTGNNKLDKVTDAAPDVAAGDYDKYGDIKQGQANGNYQYDEIGNLKSDASEGISDITWNVYGKIQSITKGSGTISYTYDATGNRISKTAGGKTTIYVRDASGNVMSVYTADPIVSNGNLLQSEVHLYGSSRLGIFEVQRNVQNLANSDYLNNISTFTRGNKFFELSNHLGNVLVTVSDKRLQHTTNNTTVGYYNADVVTSNDYYPFGSQMPGRKYSQANSSYRYGFNGKEKDNDINGDGNAYDFGARIQDPRLGRWLSVDPLQQKYTDLSAYQYCANSPISAKDPDGRLIIFINGMWGGIVGIAKPKEEYWTSNWVSSVQSRIEGKGSKTPLFFDGSVGGQGNFLNTYFQEYRRSAGEMAGYDNAASIINKLDKGETIKIITNSMGAAFERGFTKGLLQYQTEENERRTTFNAGIDNLVSQLNESNEGLNKQFKKGSQYAGLNKRLMSAIATTNQKIEDLRASKKELLNVRIEMNIDLSSHQTDYPDPNAEQSYYMMANEITPIQSFGGLGVSESHIKPPAQQIGVNPDGTSQMTGHSGRFAPPEAMPESATKIKN